MSLTIVVARLIVIPQLLQHLRLNEYADTNVAMLVRYVQRLQRGRQSIGSATAIAFMFEVRGIHQRCVHDRFRRDDVTDVIWLSLVVG